jgi:WD40 repeat protein
MGNPSTARWLAAVVLACLAPACQATPPEGTLYYDRVIQPILSASCARGSSGCHAADPADPFAFASGNLDLTSFASLHKRPDLLRAFGAYPSPMLLLKAVAETDQLAIAYRDQTLPSRIPHVGGSLLQVSSPAFLTLQRWLENGATRDGLAPIPGPVAGTGDCPTTVPPDFVPTDVTSTPQWAAYSGELDAVRDVIVRHGCAAGSCHGAPASDFYFTCGDDLANRAFQFRQVWAFVATPAARSPILTIPGLGSSHSGGVLFMPGDADAKILTDFAAHVGELPFAVGDPLRAFFADRVMPVLLQRGCAAEGCHSPAAMNDFKLHAGAPGAYSAIALERNYRLARDEFMALELPDARRGRLLAKNIFPAHGGIAHRGGPLLEEGGADPTHCAPVYDPATASPFCTIWEWARRERAQLGNPGSGPSVPLIYVERQTTHLAGPLEATRYQPGSDLLVRDATLDAAGGIAALGAARSLLDGCPGAADRSLVDVRGPDVNGDGATVAFAMRTGASDTMHLYTVDVSGAGCVQLAAVAGAHDFDPAWSPDGGTWIVFASTRAGGTSRRLGLPQSDLWRVRADGSGAQRMTFLSNAEVSPQFMRDGRVIMSTEKVDARDPQAGFYQISGRRLNWDLTDYHPLLGQRRMSPDDFALPGGLLPSIGYQQVTEIREAPDGSFLMVLSDFGARGGAGTIGVFNRSVGPFEADRFDAGYLRSVTVPDPTAGGRAAAGAWRSPFPLPDGRILASHAAVVGDLDTIGAIDWDLAALDPRTGAVTPILTAAGSQLEAVLALPHPPRELYLNRRQLVFGGGQDASDPSHAFVYITDAPMIGTLLGANLRRGRHIDELAGADHLDIFDAAGAPVTSVPLASDGSLRLRVPAGAPFYLGLSRAGTPLLRMSEEHQFGPGEHISLGVRREVFDHVCGGCHGSVSGRELDVAVSADALTGASESLSKGAAPVLVGP